MATKTARKPKATPTAQTEQPPANLSKYQRPMEIVHRSLLKGAPYNPRHIDPVAKRKLRKSVDKFGLVDPVVWNRRSGNVVGGHQRLDALDTLHQTNDYSLNVVVVDLDDKAEKELNVALNNPNIQGYYDIDKLHAIIEDTPGIDIHNMGFELPDLQMLYMDHGKSPDLLDRFYSAEALATMKRATGEANALMDEAEAIRQEKKDREGLAGQDEDFDSDSESDEEAEKLAAIKARRQEYADRVSAENEADFLVVIVFETDARKQAFLKALELDPFAKEVDGPNLAEALDIELPPCVMASEESQSETVPF